MNLPTKSGYYWILQNIGLTVVRTVASVYVKDGKVLVRSSWDPVHRDVISPDWNKDIIIQPYKEWNQEYLAWLGPIDPPEEFLNCKTGEKENWLKTN